MKNKIKKIKSMNKKLIMTSKQLIKEAKKHKLALIQTALLILILVRVEMLHSLVSTLTQTIEGVTIELYTRIVEADAQFKQTMLYIISLFGGEGA